MGGVIDDHRRVSGKADISEVIAVNVRQGANQRRGSGPVLADETKR